MIIRVLIHEYGLDVSKAWMLVKLGFLGGCVGGFLWDGVVKFLILERIVNWEVVGTSYRIMSILRVCYRRLSSRLIRIVWTSGRLLPK